MDRTIKEKDEISQKERRKELKCIYEVEKLLGPSSKSMDEVLAKVAEAMRSGWMYPEECVVQINYQNMQIGSSNFCSTSWCLQNELVASGRKVGEIKVCYLKELPATDVGPFLNEEVKLLENIGNLLAAYLDKYEGVAGDDKQKKGAKTANWKMALEMISKSDAKLLMLVTKKMLYQLCLSNNAKAQALLEQFDKDAEEKSNESFGDANVPLKKKGHFDVIDLRDEIFEIATSFFSDHEIFSFLDAWSQQHNANFLVDILSNQQSSMSDIINAISRYLHIYQNTKNLPGPTKRQLLVSLIGRFITTSPEYIRVAKNFFEIEDFLEILHFVITPTRGHGTIGGKGAGMFLAYKILSKESSGDFGTLKIPKTWYLSTDAFDNFIHHNNLGDLFEQKYRPIDQIRQEHPHIVQLFKSSPFSSDIIKGLTKALEDLGDLPLVVRSSSILEDSFTASFAGKYKSLFLANQGSRDQRLSALMDAIAEIYASTFAPDPISYRSERNLLDVKESMGIMIQAVVGQKVHDYYFPSLAGVMFSNNEFRWSKRIKRDDGLLRIVPGLGTRAVDRVSDDYPILIAPGQPGLRVNISVEEVARYSPKKIDLINLKKGTFETHDVYKILKELGYDYPKLKQIVSIYDRTRIYRPAGVDLDIENREMVVTFEGLFSDTNFIAQMKQYINQLKEVFEFPVDVEFAHDGNDFYLLQCRPQINGQDSRSIPIPKNISKERTLFSANKFISNGAIPDITHIVYVDPQSYSKVASIDDLIRVGEAIGLLNKILPKRRFILMGPGRWGSRGDIKLGVRTSYSDLNNTAVLIEIARKKGNYTPELSFGTHFFQDLVESSIRYIPLYPDDEEVDFNNDFFQNATNLLADLAPNYQDLSAVVRVIDVGQNSEGKILRIVMSSEEDRALGFLTYADDLTGHMEEAPPSPAGPPISASNFSTSTVFNVAKGNIYERSRWNWRMYMALELSKQLDRERFGVVDLYLIGSVKTETFDAESDIDLLVHFAGDEHQLCSLSHWLEGWSRCLGVMNYLYSGYRREELLDVKIVTDANIEEKYKYAVKIGAATDSALKLGGK
ncbi:MAG: hypothetical protein A2504_02915 [Bdellovibrionales bacterium RIFOXYD12_FULL_39_22]|nr:MAG: hypothetical protein A2385_05630 [Bdellovibrionales bacterium RIFOXYB1_FULL_39_21]OFZ42274.1 MAG: hypothetical protein A2485_15660 [Bdellovibrionales bacterium RIFOXYC12_FULL_39_17]OFZ46823.1 MAG: hypothetical protein A2404_04010 [Bdellovibrionales bacterium RIFOXYC1_FULL_39_130]OFZ76101.1 MAG: hypothetical protein A2560_03140 [Bdellovibrionales bacterium RIFOXYD1_FULL_39_84]OFZ93073.1 MAG: hypothetical protein A2504_02915 [Bdellovibrionales bacterium RIFOXYD12_FULL_39_22]